MRASLRIVSGIGLLSVLTEGRTWHSVIEHEIYAKYGNDPYRAHQKVELDPLFELSVEELYELQSPTAAPHSSQWFTWPPSEVPSASPSMIPSDFPSLSPSVATAAPTERVFDVAGNGGCTQGSSLYQVGMYDSWGDGWHIDTVLQIEGIADMEVEENHPGETVTKTTTADDGETIVTVSRTFELDPTSTGLLESEQGTQIPDPLGMIFTGGLQEGTAGAGEVCLRPRRCYEVIVGGGDHLNEVSWDIRPVDLGLGENEQAEGVILEGRAPMTCIFSLPDESGEVYCPTSCDTQIIASFKAEASVTLDQAIALENADAGQQHVPGEDVFEYLRGHSHSNTTTRT